MSTRKLNTIEPPIPLTPERLEEWEASPTQYKQMGLIAKWRLEDWLYNISVASESFHTLTEEEWQEAVSHFNGCAICGADEVATRGYFIPFKNGGEYAAWNILPLCSSCAARSIRQHNIFRTFKNGVGHGASAVSNILPNAPTKYYSAKRCTAAEEAKFLNAVRYLQSKMGDDECLRQIG